MAEISSLLTTLLEIHGEVKKKLESGRSEELFNLSVTEKWKKNGHILYTKDQLCPTKGLVCIF